jgi:UDP-N-acetyl-2-amino-2-deoxyglucuronate dehydrogenase
MSAPIGFAIVGTGMIAEVHAQAIAQTPEARLVSVWTRSSQRRDAFAQRFACKSAPSLEAIASDPEVRAICVATPSGAHAEVAVPLLEAGKAVLCEKPLEVTIEAVDRILEAEKRGGGMLAGVFQMRLGHGVKRLKAAIDAGRFGRLTLCSAYIKWWRARSYYESSSWKGTLKMDGGGALMNQGIHAVDMLQWLVGLPEEVSAFSARLAHANIEAEDTVAAVLRFPHGGLGVIEASTSSYPGTDLRIEIMGDSGSATLINDKIVRWDFAEPKIGDETALTEHGGTVIKGGTSDPKGINLEGHRILVHDVALAIRDGRPPMISGGEARRAVSLVLAIYEAARTGQRTPVQR